MSANKIIKNAETHSYEDTGMLTQSNILVYLKVDDLEKVHNSWPESFDIVFDVGSTVFERLFASYPAVVQHFQLNEINPKQWREDGLMQRLILHLQQKLHEALCKFWDDCHGYSAERTHIFCLRMQTFGGKFHRLVPKIDLQDILPIFDVIPDAQADMASLNNSTGPLTNDERNCFIEIWRNILNIVRPHFIYGWENDIVISKSQNDEKPEQLSKRRRIINKVSRLLSRDSSSEGSTSHNSSGGTRNKDQPIESLLHNENVLSQMVDPVQLSDIRINRAPKKF